MIPGDKIVFSDVEFEFQKDSEVLLRELAVLPGDAEVLTTIVEGMPKKDEQHLGH